MTPAPAPSRASRPLHVVVCNERLLPRFGLDRALLLLGRGLVGRGHRVTFVCARCDQDAVAAVSRALIQLPRLASLDLHGAEAEAAGWLAEHWGELSAERAPDVVVSGGWPFLRVAEVCARLGVPSLFIDAGAVPHDGMTEDARIGQRELRRARARALPRFTAVAPSSAFIRETQTLPDRGTARGVHTVPLGADHLAAPMFAAPTGGAPTGGAPTGGASVAAADAEALARVGALTAAGLAPILLLGRFEAEGYKNSPRGFEVLARILERVPEARLLVLARSDELAPPEAARHAVVPLGFIGDAALAAIMRACRLGLSVSLWEGFNLPLVEMQWGGGLALAFNVGAHPEVVLDPWLLCGGVAEMADKAVRVLRDGPPPHLAEPNPPDPHVPQRHLFEPHLPEAGALARFQARFRWADVIARYGGIIETLATSPPAASAPSGRRLVLVDCSNAAADPGNPGVIRVTRRLGEMMRRDPSLLAIFLRWDAEAGQYRALRSGERDRLASYDGPVDGISRILSAAGPGEWPIDNLLALFEAAAPAVLFLPEVVLDGGMPERLLWARARGLLVAALLYDLIPVTHSVLCPPAVVGRFPEYLEGVASCDAVWAISGETLLRFEQSAARHSLPRPAERAAIWLPAQLGARPRAGEAATPPDSDGIMALCVSSIEPRKNHRALVEAFRALLARRPELRLRLVLAGNRFEGADALADWLLAVTREEPRISWTGLVGDAELAALVGRSAFTIYPSLVEGYGLPITESLWMGRPCLCHNSGVMAELAAEGGCLTADMADPAAIERAIERLAEDAPLRRRLTARARRRALLDWAGYGARICGRLRELRAWDPVTPRPPLARPAAVTIGRGGDGRGGDGRGEDGRGEDGRGEDGRGDEGWGDGESSDGEVAASLLVREEAAALRLLPERFVRVTDVPVEAAHSVQHGAVQHGAV